MSIPGDFTAYLRRDVTSPPPAPQELTDTGSPPGSTPTSSACTISFDLRQTDKRNHRVERVTARSLTCPCFRGRYYSVTCRTMSKSNDNGAFPWPVDASLENAGRKPLQPKVESGKEKIAESTGELIDHLWEKLEIERRPKPLTGLIVVAGRTGSGKSEIARALTRKFMEHAIKLGGRRPHLLTYEDPIEELFRASPQDAARSGIDYTPREKGVDVSNLKQAVRDALRQTPALFYVGETRDEKDWKELLRFAGTGHLTITTGHAGSLVETMAQILHAADARSPAARSRVAGRIAALVHLRPEPLVAGGKVLIPAFWFRSPRSISAFTAEGLGSLLPNRPRRREQRGEQGSRDSYGRAYAVENLPYLKKENDELLRNAVEWDLRGD